MPLIQDLEMVAKVEASKILAIAIERWLFDMCFTCGEPQCADWCIDLDTQAWAE